MNQNKPEKTGFIEELKRRNVFRVAVAYLVSAWLLLQLADIVLENIAAPQWVMQAFMLALAVGLPIALIFAWAFELTPEGLKRERDVDRSQSITPQTGRKLDFIIIGVLAVVIAILLVDRFTGAETDAESLPVTASSEEQEATEKAPATTSEKSIAVLPFVNMSSDPEQEYFSDGISEEILNALAKVTELKVAGRTSSFAFKGENQDLRKVGEALGVKNILEGSVRKSGTKVRITAQLIQVDDGFHLWSESYDRELTDVFEIQDEIAKAILEQLKAHLLADEQVRVVATRADSQAYDLYLLAKQRIYERSRPALESANELLDRALTIDPDYAPAYAQRAIATMLLSDRNYGQIPREQARSQARVYIDQALRLDPEQDEALAALGLYYAHTPGSFKEAIQALEHSLAINPSNVNAANWLHSAYADAGQVSKAIKLLEDLRERDPLYRPGIANLNRYYIFQSRLDEALAQIESLKPFMPNDPFLLRLEANVFYAQGRTAEGLRTIETALTIQPDNFANVELLGTGLDATGQYERLAEEGIQHQQPYALIQLGRSEEAFLTAQKLADTGEDVLTYIGLLANYGRANDAIQYVEQRWKSLSDFAQDNPSNNGFGASAMLDLAYAYSVVGNQQQFDEAMTRARAGLDEMAGLGFSNPYLDFINAVYHALAGDHDQALAKLSTAIDRNLTTGTKLSSGWGALKVLEGNPEYEAIQARMIKHVNGERSQLGLEPISI